MSSRFSSSPHSADMPTRAQPPLAAVVVRQVTMERILAEIDRLAVLPTIAMEVIRAADDPSTRVAELETIISRDPGITARLFKLANAAFFARRGKISTIDEAIKRLGFRTIKSLVVAASAGQVFARPMRRYPYRELGLWQHSLGLAMVSRQLARSLQLSLSVQDELFLDGLLHDIGKLVLDPLLGECDAGNGYLTTDMESAVVGLDHTEVGRRIAEQWHLPEHVTAVITHHHAVGSDEEFRQHIATAHLADCMLNHARLGIAEEAEVVCPVDPMALTALHMDTQNIEELEAEMTANLPEIVTLCDELGSW